MSTHSLVVEIISGNNRKTVTLDCLRSASVLEVTQALCHYMSTDEKQQFRGNNSAEPELPDTVILRDRHGTRLHPNRKISKIGEANGTHLIAELSGGDGDQTTDGRQHDEVKRSLDSSTEDDSQEFEDTGPAKTPRAPCTRNRMTSVSPSKNKRRKVKSEEVGGAFDTPSSSSSTITIDDSDSDQTSQIHTKRKSRRRAKPTDSHKVSQESADSRQQEENQCGDCRGIKEESPTVKLGLKRRHGGIQSDQSPSRVSLRLRRRTCLMCSCDTQQKSASRGQRRKTPNSKTDPVNNSWKVNEMKRTSSGETGSSEKEGRGSGATGLKEDHLSDSLQSINLEDKAEGNLQIASPGASKEGGQSEKILESAMTSNEKSETTQKNRISVSGKTKDTVISRTDQLEGDWETTFQVLTVGKRNTFTKTLQDSAGEPGEVDPKHGTIEEVDESAKKCEGTNDKHFKATFEENPPVNKVGMDSVEKPDSTQELAEPSSRYFSVNTDVIVGDVSSTSVNKNGNQSEAKVLHVKKSTNNIYDNTAKCLTAIVGAKEKSPTKMTGFIRNPFAIPVNAGNSSNARETTITCAITVTTRASHTSVNKNHSKVIHIVPAEPVRYKAVSKQLTKANLKGDKNFVCVDADEFEEDSSMQDFVGDADSSPDDPIVASIGKNELKKSDLETLEEGEWLNDCVINAYFFLLSEKSSSSIFTHSSFFFFSLFKRGYEGVKRWTKNVDLFEQDLIFIPIHNKSHWSLVVVHVKKGIIEYYNSSTLLDGYPRSMMHIRDYLKSEAKNREKTEFCDIKWEMYVVGDIPRQQNMDDCGLFICQYAKKLSLNKKVNFDIKKKTINLRRQMLRELIKSDIEEC